MSFYCEIEEECEMQYQITQRPARGTKNSSRPYSPRHEKQRSPAGANNGIHRRGKRCTLRV